MKKSFTNYMLSDEIITALDYLQYTEPTEVQEKAIPVALKKQDVIVKSQTGSGKTASFAIPVCELVEWIENKPQALVLAPTRELAVQVKEDMTNIGRLKRIKATAVFGKQSFAKQKLELKQKTHIVVGTPGRVLDHIEKGTFIVDNIQFLVIDEADEMLNMGFIEQVEAIIEKLPSNRVTMLFSATMPEDIQTLSNKYMNNPVTIEIETSATVEGKIEHVLYKVGEEEKFELLKDVTTVENPDSCILFCRTQQQVNALFNQLERIGYDCDKIHGGMYQEDRLDVMEDFKRGEFRYLVATDVAARGIDIENITHVINYDLPLEKESYVHRTGRTGRAGNSGKAITFVTPAEEKFLTEIESYIGFSIPEKEAPSKVDVAIAKDAFNAKMNALPEFKQDRSANLNKDIMKLYFNGGKKKKLRAVDFVGTIARIPGVTAEDIGIITIQDTCSYVESLHGKGPLVLQTMKKTTIKGKMLKVHKAKK